jgi:hypothetical protein
MHQVFDLHFPSMLSVLSLSLSPKVIYKEMNEKLFRVLFPIPELHLRMVELIKQVKQYMVIFYRMGNIFLQIFYRMVTHHICGSCSK